MLCVRQTVRWDVIGIFHCSVADTRAYEGVLG
jgi:hypothetical protein